ncbi:hypothetical protein WICMUC_003081 [Wickerhamomyces mucosus]|uniref:Uncharacterized protein n=1 Tax=Wickerhamomyces mucosus TaxID=1378264 RepID=A0A9P8TDV3_9ASCO|nr:hypothetical protein WICMUC_003081 [Wickerhamomyces mucosus]
MESFNFNRLNLNPVILGKIFAGNKISKFPEDLFKDNLLIKDEDDEEILKLIELDDKKWKQDINKIIKLVLVFDNQAYLNEGEGDINIPTAWVNTIDKHPKKNTIATKIVLSILNGFIE